MTITTEDLRKIDEGFHYNSPATVRGSEYQLQKILGMIDSGDVLCIEDLKTELNSIEAFKKFAAGQYYFGILDFDDLLMKWKA